MTVLPQSVEQLNVETAAALLDRTLVRLEEQSALFGARAAALEQQAMLLLAYEAQRLQCYEKGAAVPFPALWMSRALLRQQALSVAKDLECRYREFRLCYSAPDCRIDSPDKAVRKRAAATIPDLVRQFQNILDRMRSKPDGLIAMREPEGATNTNHDRASAPSAALPTVYDVVVAARRALALMRAHTADLTDTPSASVSCEDPAIPHPAEPKS